MKHPSSAKVFEFVEKLENVVWIANKPCKCEVRCHLSSGPDFGLDYWAERALGRSGGVSVIADHLGFAYWQIKEWAKKHPQIWGNPFGYEMFQHPEAFGQDEWIFPVQVLIDHWRGVGERLKAMESVSPQPLETGEAK